MAGPETIEDVIEEQRVLRGASDLRVTLGEGATAEGLRSEFARLNRKTDAYEAFEPIEIEKSRVARMKRLMREIFDMTRSGQDATKDDLRKSLADISMKVDMIPDADIEEDTLWMARQRVKRGQALPPEVEALDLDLSVPVDTRGRDIID